MSFRSYVADAEARVPLMVTEVEQETLHVLAEMRLIPAEAELKVGNFQVDVEKIVEEKVAALKADILAEIAKVLPDPVKAAQEETADAVKAAPEITKTEV